MEGSRMGSDAHNEGIEEVDLGYGLRRHLGVYYIRVEVR